DAIDRDAVERRLAELVGGAHPVTTEWITDDEMAARPELVRTMSVKPPMGLGRVRLLRIEGVDLQPCGGTHVRNTSEIGALRVAKLEKKSARTRRLVLEFA
ncbi:putative metal-dependent hydrolase, partial [Burkholderia sp. TJI49]